MEKLSELGVPLENFDDSYQNSSGKVYVSDTDMRDVWIALLNYVEPKLNLVVVENLPMLPFYGFDEQKRHIGQVGYGCFD